MTSPTQQLLSPPTIAALVDRSLGAPVTAHAPNSTGGGFAAVWRADLGRRPVGRGQGRPARRRAAAAVRGADAAGGGGVPAPGRGRGARGAGAPAAALQPGRRRRRRRVARHDVPARRAAAPAARRVAGLRRRAGPPGPRLRRSRPCTGSPATGTATAATARTGRPGVRRSRPWSRACWTTRSPGASTWPATPERIRAALRRHGDLLDQVAAAGAAALRPVGRQPGRCPVDGTGTGPAVRPGRRRAVPVRRPVAGLRLAGALPADRGRARPSRSSPGTPNGPGQPIVLDEPAVLRLGLYRMHLDLLMAVEMPSRGMTTPADQCPPRPPRRAPRRGTRPPRGVTRDQEPSLVECVTSEGTFPPAGRISCDAAQSTLPTTNDQGVELR